MTLELWMIDYIWVFLDGDLTTQCIEGNLAASLRLNLLISVLDKWSSILIRGYPECTHKLQVFNGPIFIFIKSTEDSFGFLCYECIDLHLQLFGCRSCVVPTWSHRTRGCYLVICLWDTSIGVHFAEEFSQATHSVNAFGEDLLLDASYEVVSSLRVVYDGFVKVLGWLTGYDELP